MSICARRYSRHNNSAESPSVTRTPAAKAFQITTLLSTSWSCFFLMCVQCSGSFLFENRSCFTWCEVSILHPTTYLLFTVFFRLPPERLWFRYPPNVIKWYYFARIICPNAPDILHINNVTSKFTFSPSSVYEHRILWSLAGVLQVHVILSDSPEDGHINWRNK